MGLPSHGGCIIVVTLVLWLPCLWSSLRVTEGIVQILQEWWGGASISPDGPLHLCPSLYGEPDGLVPPPTYYAAKSIFQVAHPSLLEQAWWLYAGIAEDPSQGGQRNSPTGQKSKFQCRWPHCPSLPFGGNRTWRFLSCLADMVRRQHRSFLSWKRVGQSP